MGIGRENIKKSKREEEEISTTDRTGWELDRRREKWDEKTRQPSFSS